MDLQLKGKKALVSGASRGIGRAIAELLADEGADLAICARKEKALVEAAADLEKRGGKVFYKTVDIKDGEALKGWVGESANVLGGIDIIVCNPSSGNGGGEAGWKSNFEVDLMGSVRSVEAAMPHLAKSGAGSIVFISFTAALETFMNPSPYNAIKAALICHASGLSQDLAKKGFRVNTLSPGPIEFEGGNWAMVKKMMPPMYEQTLSAIAAGRMGTPQEVARAAVFLASPAASFITGANLVVDGGFTKRVDY